MAKIAIIGTGISGLGAAYLLGRKHEIVVYEKAPRIGGHSRTITVDGNGRPVPVDTGFIVFNEKNYPQLSAMFRHLNVAVHKSDMTFAASIRDGWLEWGAKDLNAIFGQRRNLLRPRFAQLIRDVLRFNARAEDAIARQPDLTLDELVDALDLGDWFRRFYLLPMTAAIWSCPPHEMLRFPAATLIRFMANHHLLSASGQPQWFTVTGGAEAYVARLTQGFADRIRLNCGAAEVTRSGHGVQIADTTGQRESFDHVVFASHGDETLRALADACPEERALLGTFRYQSNLAVLHRDSTLMPKRKTCWASWNYLSDGALDDPALSVTYWMNRLQNIPAETPLFVTLNPKQAIAPDKVFDTHTFEHPVFDHAVLAAQERIQAIQGRRNTWFCGAHLRYGFHEDGLSSAVHVAHLLGAETPWQAPRPDFPAPVWNLAEARAA
ncbi:MAG: FAD-dependent oxidoreductase [Proteobacteria bacterium]|nr:FAD-dependent oxidoreductase [Pseudomonadota bacterium]